MKITFLQASLPLTKTFTLRPDKTVEKSSYPNIWEVTSIIEDIPDLKHLDIAITKHGNLGNCMLKGMVTRNLTCESRKDSTDRNATTEWLCLDIDGIDPMFAGAPVTVDGILAAMGLGDVSYVLQWSGSMGISNKALRCHIFIRLTKPVSAPLIKQWLIQMNHETPVLRAHQTLSKTGNALLWGLDITACQSDKLIYIAPPVLKGIKNPLGKTPRISLVTKAKETFTMDSQINTTEQNRDLTDKRVLELRDLAGLPKRKMTYRTIGSQVNVLVKPDECIATEIRHDRGFTYFNLNGGDSWAYYHPEHNPDFIFNFKGEPVYQTKELLPQYWDSLKTQAYRVSTSGLTYLAFLDRKTSVYWRGTYNQSNDFLNLYAAKNESMVRQFAASNGLRLGDSIPEWDLEFNPQQNQRIDFNNKKINTFQLTTYMMAPPKKVKNCPPLVFEIINHILDNDVEAVEHFMNWAAFIAQNRTRSRTAWVFHGVPGTGKGLLMHKILAPLFGADQTVVKRAGELSEKWTDFVEGKFFICIDEMQSSALRDEAGVIANIKNLITDETASIRVMNKNAYPVRNYSNWIFASNKPDPVSIDKDDRRFNVGPYQGKAFRKPTDKELDHMRDVELQEFYHYLMTYVVDEEQAHTPLESKSRDTLIELTQTTSESTASALKDGDMQFFLNQLPTSDSYKLNPVTQNRVDEYRRTILDIMARTNHTNGFCNIHRDELYVIFNYTVGGVNPSPTTFTKFLGHRQITVKPVKINNRTERGISVVFQLAPTFPALIDHHFSGMKYTLSGTTT